jgi:lipopolysaccharide transport system permease protein
MPVPSPDRACVLRLDAAHPDSGGRARADLNAGLGLWRLALSLALLDIRNRYRGSVLGPLWTTLSTLVMVAGLALLYAALFRIDGATYLRHLAVSLILWHAIAGILTDGCAAFTGSAGVIRQIAIPQTVHVLRSVLRSSLTAAHALPIIPLVFLVTGDWPGAEALLVLPALLLLLGTGFAAAMLLGVLCARFRDIPPIVTNMLQLFFFLTPVLWTPDLLDRSALPWLLLNPFHPLLETLRGPLVDGGVGIAVWAAALGWSGLLAAAAWTAFRRCRARIPYWV